MPVEIVMLVATPDGRLTRANAAKFLGVTPKTLANWATAQFGPMSLKIAGRVFYRLADLRAFVDTGARRAS